MNTARDLTELYRSWRDLTANENAAIRMEAWDRVAECQEAKSQLQSLIITATESIESDPHPGGARNDSEQFRDVVNELIALEKRNSGLLSAQMNTVRSAREAADRAARNLSRIHKSYASPAAPAWHSYS